MATVGQDTHATLSGLSQGDLEMLETGIGMREVHREKTGLDSRTFALVKIAALIALDAPPASYAWQVANALEDGASPDDIVGVLRAVGPQVGGPRVIAAAPEIMVALGLALPESAEKEAEMGLLMRRRPLLRAAAVGGGAYMMGKRRAEDQQEQAIAATQPAPAAPAGGGISSEVVTRLEQLGKLHEQGVLTDEEFAAQKAKLLGM